MPSAIFSVPPCPTRSDILPPLSIVTGRKFSIILIFFCNKVTHVCCGQVQQELSNKEVNPQDSERFFGFATSGEKKMNSNQKDSYLFTPPVAPVCGAADGDPSNPSFHKPAWSIDLAETELYDLCPWLYAQLRNVDDAFVLYPSFKARKGLCFFQARACLLAMERRISQAVKMLASLPVDDKNYLISESPPIHHRRSSYCVCQLPFFQSANFLDICCHVHKAQMDQALMLDGEPPAKQKHWISHKIGDKVVPKLHACIRASQSLMHGQRLHQQETSALGHRLSSIETMLDTILQHLKTPPNLSSSDQASYAKDDDEVEVESVGVPVSPSPYLLSPPPSSDWFKLSFDPVKNSKGFARKKAAPQKVINRPFSGNDFSALDYWNEFYHGFSQQACVEGNGIHATQVSNQDTAVLLHYP
jgi:hypothetical protein